MIVERFSTLEQLGSIETRWTELYRDDPNGSLFLSWEWISACLATDKGSWVVLGVREPGLPHVAFLPLTFSRSALTGGTLTLGPSVRADFTGMIGAAGQDERFVPALARAIEELNWDRFTLHNCSDPRINVLTAEIENAGCRAVLDEPTPCPYLQLPATWDEYISNRGRSTRHMLRSHLKRIRALPGYRFEFAPPREAERAIETLLRFHTLRWKKNVAAPNRALHDFLVRCAMSGRFVVCALRQDDQLIATQGLFVERQRNMIVAYMIAHNPDYAHYSPGVMLGCESVRWAIEEGYGYYSFSRGKQAYKMQLATDVEYLINTTLWRRTARATAIDGAEQIVSGARKLARNVVGAFDRGNSRG